MELLDSNLWYKHELYKDIKLSEEELFIDAVSPLVGQVFFNIMQNSIDALTDIDNPHIEVTTGKKENMVYFSVTDNGEGIPNNLVHRIFDPFFTTRKNNNIETANHTGLGLFICSKIIDSHKGFIKVDSLPGERTNFRVSIPVRNDSASLLNQPDKIFKHEI